MKSYADLAAIWRRVDGEVASTPMPEEYACWVAHILCNDCNQVQGDFQQRACIENVWAMMHEPDCLKTLKAFAESYQLCFAISSCLILEISSMVALPGGDRSLAIMHAGGAGTIPHPGPEVPPLLLLQHPALDNRPQWAEAACQSST